MFDTVHARSGMPLALVESLVSRLPARSVAVVVAPREDVTAFQRADALSAIAARAARDGKEVTIVGGTPSLRARAVMAGLMAATTLEDWRAACRGREADLPLWPREPQVAGGHPHLWIVDPAASTVAVDADEPPDYLRAILPYADAGVLPTEDAASDEPTSGTADADIDARIMREVEHREDILTERILSTAGRDPHVSAEASASASGARLARGPWTHPLAQRLGDAEGARLS